ncbi:MAG TPA: VanZ family protein [Pyrinomonadaceae bacterium]|nr:VanZ family protein [Pyrinomonadaceae bacterium]
MARLLSRYVPLLAWLALISYASSGSFSASNTSRFIGPFVLWLFPNTTPETLLMIHMIVRKLAHFTEYAILGFLAARAFRTSPRPAIRDRWFLISATIVVTYALIDEYHQSFVPSRTGSIYDSLIDMAGGLTALLVIRWRTQMSAPEEHNVYSSEN